MTDFSRFELVRDPRYGYWRVHPRPTPAQLAEFYARNYVGLLAQGGRAPDMAKLLTGGEAAARERQWLESTVYADIAEIFEEHAKGRRALDIGCGSADLVGFLAGAGFSAEGLDPSREAVEQARRRGLTVHEGTLDDFARRGAERYDAASMIGVLECSPDPEAALADVRRLLRPGAPFVLRVGNQFNPLQLAARDSRGLPQWWVTVPDHLNYFDRETVTRLVAGSGFAVVDCFGDFPMEMFLLMGDDYVSRPETGPHCHARRVAFESALPAADRRRLYRAMAGAGIGRSIFVVALAR